jgi:thiol-disulfide isomerase/thioredoxin
LAARTDGALTRDILKRGGLPNGRRRFPLPFGAGFDAAVFMKKIIFIAVLSIIAATVYAQNTAAGLFRSASVHMFAEPVPVSAMDFSVPLLAGGDQTLSALKGKVVFLNFWATWCPPCRSEMPSMETLYQRYKNGSFQLLAVDLGEKSADVNAFIKKQKFSFPVGLDLDSSVSNQYAVDAIPTSYIINKEGFIVGAVRGSTRWNTPAMYALFDYLLEQ